jgi:PilZ domain
MAESAERVTGTIENRKYHRSTVLWPATLISRNTMHDCVIFNISANGAKVILKAPLEGVTTVILSCPRFGDLEAEIVWRNQSSIGLRFSAPPEDVARALGDTLPLLPQGAQSTKS